MKPSSILVPVVIIFMTFSSHVKAGINNCDEKEKEIRVQIKYARSNDNISQLAGLEKALSEVQQHCSTAHLQYEAQQRLENKKRNLEERQREYEEAKLSGYRRKADKKLEKVREAEDELYEARKALVN